MRKLFSIFAALTLCVGLWAAAPVAQKAQVANLNQLSATPELKVINQEAKAKIGPKDMAAQSRSVAPKKAYSSTLAYKCGPTEVVVTDLSTPTYNEFKLTITQKAKNTSEYNKETLYDNTVELILDPDEHSIVGTFTTDDYTIGASSFLKSGSNTRYVSYWENSTITIVSKGGNKYAITDGLLQVESSNGKTLYKYNYCYAADDLNNQDAEKTAFEFTFGEEPTPTPKVSDQFVDTISGLKFEVTSLDPKAVKVIANSYTGTTYTVPATVKYLDLDFAVTEIGEAAFSGCSDLQSITLPEGLTTIGSSAFAYVGDPDPALLNLPNSWTGTLPDEDGNWYGGKFEMSSIPTALPSLPYEGKVGKGSFKFFHNGQLIIRKGNKHFNALGTEVK